MLLTRSFLHTHRGVASDPPINVSLPASFPTPAASLAAFLTARRPLIHSPDTDTTLDLALPFKSNPERERPGAPPREAGGSPPCLVLYLLLPHLHSHSLEKMTLVSAHTSSTLLSELMIRSFPLALNISITGDVSSTNVLNCTPHAHTRTHAHARTCTHTRTHARTHAQHTAKHIHTQAHANTRSQPSTHTHTRQAYANTDTLARGLHNIYSVLYASSLGGTDCRYGGTD